MSEPLPLDRSRPLWGRDLRHAALAVLDRCGSASIGEILDVLWAADFRLEGDRARMGKRLADALRHETRRGRAQRVAWGRYAIARLAATTRWRILRRWDDAAPASLDEHGEPEVIWPPPGLVYGAIPWTKHDRHGDPIWFASGRHRWAIGRRVLAIHFGRLREERRRASSGRPRRSPPPAVTALS